MHYLLNTAKHVISLAVALLVLLHYHQFAYCNGEPQYPITEISPSLLEGAQAVVRLNERTYTVQSPAEAVQKVHFVVTMLKPTELYNEFLIYYSKESKVKAINARFYDAQGKLLRKLSTEEITDHAALDGFSLYNDNRLKYIQNAYGVYPYTFEISYEVHYKAIFSYPSFLLETFGAASQGSQFIIDMPQDLKLYYQTLNSDLKPTITTDKNRTIYTWKTQAQNAKKDEPYIPSPSTFVAQVQTAPERFAIDNYEGSMATWQKFGEFTYQLNKDRDQLPQATLDTIQKLTANAKTNTEKIDLLYRYLQRQMRYVSIQVGIGGWQTFDAQYVDKNKYGDCKALSNYMKAMLKAVGINAYIALISAGDDSYFQPDDQFCFPKFNHVILYLPQENIWLECTSNDNPTGYLGAFTQGRKALLITEKGGQLVQTPTLNDSQNKQQTHTTVTLASNGNATLQYHADYYGALQDDLRNEFTDSKKAQFLKHYKSQINLNDLNLQNVETDIDQTQAHVKLSYQATSNKYATQAGSRMFVPIYIFKSNIPQLANEEKRRFPICLDQYAYAETDTVQLELPQGYELETPLQPVSLNEPYGNYTTQVSYQNNQLIWIRHLQLPAKTFKPEDYNAIRAFYQKINQVDAAKVVLKKQP